MKKMKKFTLAVICLIINFVSYGQTEKILISNRSYMEVTQNGSLRSVKVYDACWTCQGTGGEYCPFCAGRGIDGYGMYATLCRYCYGGKRPCRACHSGTPGYQLIADYTESNVDYAKLKDHTAYNLSGLSKGDMHAGSIIKSVAHTVTHNSDWWLICYENGYTHSLNFVTCTSCRGSKLCNLCHGIGYQHYPSTGQRFPCRICHGSKDCSLCNGSGIALHEMIKDPNGFELSKYGDYISGGYGGGSSSSSRSSNRSESSSYNPCPVCYGSGECLTCLGRGVYYEGKWTNTTRACTCDNGNCRACHGTGQRR